MWKQRLVLLVVLAAVLPCHADVEIEDESPASPKFSSSTLCDMLFCKCLEHDTNNTYGHNSSLDADIKVDIYCTCENSNVKVFNLLSPLPLPPNTHLVHVSNCPQVNVTPIQNVYPVPPEQLVITNVAKLQVETGGSFWGRNILIKDVGLIEEIPLGVVNCATFSSHPMTSFNMYNVTVNEIRQGAFASIYFNDKFELNNVKIMQIDEYAFDVRIKLAKGEFKIVNSWIQNVSASGLGAIAHTVNIQHVVFTTLEPHAIRMLASQFTMANSSVIGTVEAFAFDVQAGDVKFVHNTLFHLKSTAFFAVRKTEWASSWLFAFANNKIMHASPGSLNPNWTLGRHDLVRENVFEDCSCTSLDWLWQAKHGTNILPVIRDFYDALTDRNSENFCNELEQCTPLTLHQMMKMYDPADDICSRNASYAELCYIFYNSHSKATSHVSSVISYVTLYSIALVFSNKL